MSVQELLEILLKVEDKSIDLVVWDCEYDQMCFVQEVVLEKMKFK